MARLRRSEEMGMTANIRDAVLRGHFTLRAPMSHIGESISTTAYLAQAPVVQPGGGIEQVFRYSGNAWRGQLRDESARYMLERIGVSSISLQVFHLLFAGGAIGGEQAVDIAAARAWRRAIPHLRLFGGGVGNQILPGSLRVSNCLPVCREAWPALLHTDRDEAMRTSYRALTYEDSFTRKDDSKDDRVAGWLGAPTAPALPQPQAAALPGMGAEPEPKKKGYKEPKEAPPEQMRTTVELVAAGTRLETRLQVMDADEVLLGCLVAAVAHWGRSPHIGGQANRGHGLADVRYDLLDQETGEIRPFLAAGASGTEMSAEAEAARAAYDTHLREVYDAMLAERGGEMARMLGAAVA
jgi:CRISPR type IV-associated protein Csf2